MTALPEADGSLGVGVSQGSGWPCCSGSPAAWTGSLRSRLRRRRGRGCRRRTRRCRGGRGARARRRIVSARRRAVAAHRRCKGGQMRADFLQLGLCRFVEPGAAFGCRLAARSRRQRSARCGTGRAFAAEQLGQDAVSGRELRARAGLARRCGDLPADDVLQRLDVSLQLGNAALRGPVNDAAGISFNAASALRRFSVRRVSARLARGEK